MVYLVLLKKELNTLAHTISNATATLHHFAQIGLAVTNRNSVISSMLYVLKNIGALKQRLGRNTAPVKANTAQFRTLYHAHFHSQLRCTDSSHIATRPASNNYKIVTHFPFNFGSAKVPTKYKFERGSRRTCPDFSGGAKTQRNNTTTTLVISSEVEKSSPSS